MARILPDSRQRLNLFQGVLTGSLHLPGHLEGPALQIDFRIIHIVAVKRELRDRSQFRVSISGCEMTAMEPLGRSPVAKRKAFLEERVAKLRDGKGPQQDDRGDLQQTATRQPTKVAFVGDPIHPCPPQAAMRTAADRRVGNATPENKRAPRV